MNNNIVPLSLFWQPRYWPAWLGVGLLQLIILLPQPARMAIGRLLGRIVQRVIGSRNRIAASNIRICFPELSATEQKTLVRRHFESIGMGVIELGISWLCSDAEIAKLVKTNGVEHLHAALQQGNGVLLWSGHFSSTEICGRDLEPLVPPMACMYRPNKNPLTDQLMRRCRRRSIAELIAKSSIRQLIRSLKDNRIVWYAADQAYTGKGYVLAPFFGEMAATNTAVSQICKLSNTPVVMYFPFREHNGASYRVEILPPLTDFPSGDPQADAIRLNAILEEQIRKAPEQYYWVHRRFKGRPAEFPDPYK